MSTEKDKKELAKVAETALTSFVIAQPPAEYLEDMKGVKVEYPQLKVPAGGALFFDVDGEPLKELRAIIAYKRPMRVYYETGLDEATEGNNPPDCFSNDFIVGYRRIPSATGDDATHETCDCRDCEFAQWGSAGRGQACKEKTELYVLLEGNFLPMRFTLPVTSKVMFDQYITRLMNKGERYCSVITKITLSKQTTTSGKKIDYSRTEFTMDRKLTEAETAQILSMQESIKGTLK